MKVKLVIEGDTGELKRVLDLLPLPAEPVAPAAPVAPTAPVAPVAPVAPANELLSRYEAPVAPAAPAEERSTISVGEIKKQVAKRGRPKAEPKPEPVTDIDLSEELDRNEKPATADELDAFADLFSEDDSEFISPDETKALRERLTEYSKIKSRKAAVEILERFALTSSEVKKADFPKLMALLAVK